VWKINEVYDVGWGALIILLLSLESRPTDDVLVRLMTYLYVPERTGICIRILRIHSP
jgi:hypothetical protein